MNTITQGTIVMVPTQVLGYSATQPSGNKVHPIPGRAVPDVTLRPAGTRTGTLELGWYGLTSEADSKTAANAFAAGGVFTLTTDDRATLTMFFVVSEGGQITRTLEPESRDAWLVNVDFQEVTL